MNPLDKFLNDNMVVERAQLLIHVNELLIKLGHHDHVHNIDNLLPLHGNVETMQVLMLIESELIQACHSLSLMYHVVCRREYNVLPYLSLLQFLDYIENTVESETVIYYYNEELTPEEQLLSWVEVFRVDLEFDISTLILDVMPTLIDNIIQIHELRVDVVPVEYNEDFHNKLKFVKVLKNSTVNTILPVKLIQDQIITNTLTVEQIYKQFATMIYSNDAIDSSFTAINIVGFCLITNDTVDNVRNNSHNLTNMLYSDVKKVNILINKIDEVLNPTGELCKTMNTI